MHHENEQKHGLSTLSHECTASTQKIVHLKDVLSLLWEYTYHGNRGTLHSEQAKRSKMVGE